MPKRRAFARARSSDRRRWERLRLVILAHAGYRCRTCGRAGRLEVDHVAPMHAGGAEWEPSNLQTLCRGCHIAKSRQERPTPKVHPEVAAWRRLLYS
ncbi:MAG: HNH endonuclease signature motif containing protein [Acidobacteria bacterium]|nr:HNH endonuclease signature motif containing protein [Acidobacteriota bacterium]